MSYPPQPPQPGGPPAGSQPPGGQQPPGSQPPAGPPQPGGQQPGGSHASSLHPIDSPAAQQGAGGPGHQAPSAPQYGSQQPPQYGQQGQQPPQYSQQGQQPPQYPGQPQQPGGHDPYAMGPGGAKPKSKMPMIGKVLTFVGAGILLVTVIVGIILAVSGASKVSALGDDVIEVHSATTHYFEAGSKWQVYASEGSGYTSCSISGPTPVSKGANQTSSFPYNGKQYRSIDGFTVQESGTYSIYCSNPDVLIAPPLSVGGIFSTVGGILIAVLGGLLGAGLTLLGIILWVVGNKKARQA